MTLIDKIRQGMLAKANKSVTETLAEVAFEATCDHQLNNEMDPQPFNYCPWCGKDLRKEKPNVGKT